MNITGNGLYCGLRFSEPDIENWMRTTVSVEVPGFEGKFSCTVETGEFKAFVEVLRLLSNSIGNDFEATWGNMEGNLEFTFLLKKLGRLECRYKFSPNNLSVGPTLRGEFESDQTYLAGWLVEAESIEKSIS